MPNYHEIRLKSVRDSNTMLNYRTCGVSRCGESLLDDADEEEDGLFAYSKGVTT